MDLATIIGLIFGVAIIGLAMISGGSADQFVNLPGVLIVFGGTLAATLIKFPAKDCLRAFRTAMRAAFFNKQEKPGDLIVEANRLAGIAKRKGPLALESEAVSNEFFNKGIQLFVDGHPPEFIEDVCKHEIELSIERAEMGERVFRGMGDSAPAFGLIGTLVGLVQMLSDLKNPDALGPAMAVALLTTLYGALIANLIANPIADKLAFRGEQQRNLMQLIIDSVLGIRNGLSPRVMAELLETYVPPAERAQIAALIEADKSAAGAQAASPAKPVAAASSA